MTTVMEIAGQQQLTDGVADLSIQQGQFVKEIYAMLESGLVNGKNEGKRKQFREISGIIEAKPIYSLAGSKEEERRSIDIDGNGSIKSTVGLHQSSWGLCNLFEQDSAGRDRPYQSVTCILRWATYREKPTCPQCKYPFEFLNVHRSLDGSLHDYMYEESVCLLLRAPWFKPLNVEDREEVYDELDDYYPFDDEEEDLHEVYLSRSSSLRIGNRRWGDNGYVRAGRQEARPVYRPNAQASGTGPSREPRKKEAAPNEAIVGRRAKRALKREAADKAAAAKHEQHLQRLGRK